MNKFLAHLSPVHFKRVLPRAVLIGAVSSLGILTGFVPDLSSLPMNSNIAYAQAAVTNEEVQSYAQSVLDMEPFRQQAYDEIKRILGSQSVPQITCNPPNSVNNLDRSIRQIAVSYCNQSRQIVERNNLTTGRFNTITSAQQSDPDLASRIQEAMIRIQRASN